MVSVFGWPDPNMAFGQSEHTLHTCYFILVVLNIKSNGWQHILKHIKNGFCTKFKCLKVILSL